MPFIASLIGGLLFGLGLTVSGMVNPEKILGFLDVAGIRSGTWDPTLALVMGGALIVAAPAYYWARGRVRCVLGSGMMVPKRRDIDRSLVIGALLFGAGWGLVGYCPGPAISGLVFGYWQTGLFVVAMIAGMGLYRMTYRG